MPDFWIADAFFCMPPLGAGFVVFLADSPCRGDQCGRLGESAILRSKAAIAAALVLVAPAAGVSAADEERRRCLRSRLRTLRLTRFDSLGARKAVAFSSTKPDRSRARPGASVAEAVVTEQTLAGYRPVASAQNPASEGLGFDEVAMYRVELAKAIKRFEDYSLVPRERQQEQVVRIDLLVSAFRLDPRQSWLSRAARASLTSTRSI